MSGNAPDRNYGSPTRARNAPAEPRHGRIASFSRNFDPAITPSRDPYPQGPTSPPQGHTPIPTVARPIPTVARPTGQVPTALQHFSEGSIVPFCRWAFAVDNKNGNKRPNHNFDPDIDNAIWWSETIDAFDNDPRLIHELVLRIANQDLGHEAMEPIRQNRAMVEMLLYRHYRRHGGILLPPMGPANEALFSHQRAVEEARLSPDDPAYPRIRFPSWPEYARGQEASQRCNAESQQSPNPKRRTGGSTRGGMGNFSWHHDRRGPAGSGGWGSGSNSGGTST